MEIGPGELDRLWSVPAERFRDVTAQISQESAASLILPFCPAVDGEVITDWPIELLARGEGARVPMLSGTNAEEMNLFRLQAVLAGAPAELSDAKLTRRVTTMIEFWASESSAAEVIELYRSRSGGADNASVWNAISTDTTFRAPMMRMLDLHSAVGNPTWSYHFTHRSEAFGGSLGAAHAVEIPFVFDNVHQQGAEFLLGPITQPRRRFAHDVADQWVRFATSERLADELTVPSSAQRWSPYSPLLRGQAVLNLESELQENLDHELISLWMDSTSRAAGR